MNTIYEPLIERDFAGFTTVARSFAAKHSVEELWTLVTRFAVLAYVPSQHAKRAVMACRAASETREEADSHWLDIIIECGRYASESRQPWSEPPILDPPEVDPSQIVTRESLAAAVDARDLEAAERWLAARGDGAGEDLRAIARGDALLMVDTALALLPLLGEKGSYALLRMAAWEMTASNADDDSGAALEERIARAIESRGAIDAVRDVFLFDAQRGPRPRSGKSTNRLDPYPLARDYAQTLIAHAVVRRLRNDGAGADLDGFLAAVHENLQHGESYADWSLA